jgi:hypothetical protein
VIVSREGEYLSGRMRDLRVQHDLSYSSSNKETSTCVGRRRRADEISSVQRDGRGCGNRHETDEADQGPGAQKIASAASWTAVLALHCMARDAGQ